MPCSVKQEEVAVNHDLNGLNPRLDKAISKALELIQ